MNLALIQEVLRHPHLRDTHDFAVLVVLATHADDNSECSLSMAELSQQARLADASVASRIIKRLAATGFLTCHSARGRGQYNRYHLHLDPVGTRPSKMDVPTCPLGSQSPAQKDVAFVQNASAVTPDSMTALRIIDPHSTFLGKHDCQSMIENQSKIKDEKKHDSQSTFQAPTSIQMQKHDCQSLIENHVFPEDTSKGTTEPRKLDPESRLSSPSGQKVDPQSTFPCRSTNNSTTTAVVNVLKKNNKQLPATCAVVGTHSPIPYRTALAEPPTNISTDAIAVDAIAAEAVRENLIGPLSSPSKPVHAKSENRDGQTEANQSSDDNGAHSNGAHSNGAHSNGAHSNKPLSNRPSAKASSVTKTHGTIGGDAMAQLWQSLVKLGVREETATALLQEHPERVAVQLEYLCARHPRNPAAMVVRAIRQNWQKPSGYREGGYREGGYREGGYREAGAIGPSSTPSTAHHQSSPHQSAQRDLDMPFNNWQRQAQHQKRAVASDEEEGSRLDALFARLSPLQQAEINSQVQARLAQLPPLIQTSVTAAIMLRRAVLRERGAKE